MKHYLNPRLLTKQVNVLLVGAGGTGSRMLENLVCLHRGLLARGHPFGLAVHVTDPDHVSQANVGRQTFYPTDIGAYKSVTLVNRANMALGTTWTASVAKVQTDTKGLTNFDLVIGAVDNRRARLGILRCLEGAMSGTRYYLDMGNANSHGQVLLGQVGCDRTAKDDPWRLPHVGEMFPDLIDSAKDEQEDDTPSCSLAEALEKQSLFVNTAMALFASNLLWQLFTEGAIDNHGAFINLKDTRVTPLEISHDTWARFGVVRDGRRHKVRQPSRERAAKHVVAA